MFNKFGDLAGPEGFELPKANPVRICYWGGSDTGDASAAIAQAQNQATQAELDMFNKAAGYEAPWRDTGTAAVKTLGGLYGLPGYDKVDPTATLTATPGYKFLQEQGNQALARYGAATGLSLSGPAAKSALNYGQQLGQTYAWAPYISGVTGLSTTGQQAAANTGQWAVGTGANLANTYMQGGQLQANLALQQANQNNSLWSDIMSGVGMVGGLALSPFTGGTSLLGTAKSALSGLFGGSSGGGYANSMPSLMTSSNFGGIGLMAGGGPVAGRKPYIIGERGPELFVPKQDGYIVPNHLLPEETPYRPAGRKGIDYIDESFGGGSLPARGYMHEDLSAFAPWRMAA